MLKWDDNALLFSTSNASHAGLRRISFQKCCWQSQHRWRLRWIYTKTFSPVPQTRDITFLFPTTIMAIPSQIIAGQCFFTLTRKEIDETSHRNNPFWQRSNLQNKDIRMWSLRFTERREGVDILTVRFERCQSVFGFYIHSNRKRETPINRARSRSYPFIRPSHSAPTLYWSLFDDSRVKGSAMRFRAISPSKKIPLSISDRKSTEDICFKNIPTV